MSTTRVKWLDYRSFVGETPSGHSVVMDGAPESGGRNLGPRPMEMLLLGLGGCSSFDVISILEKSRYTDFECEVDIRAERAEDIPKVYTKIHMHFVITSRVEIQEKHVERAIKLSTEKFCSAAKMLDKTADITHDFEIKIRE